MAEALRKRQCPLCDRLTAATDCCGIDFSARRRPWRMDKDKIRLVHVLKARKGLDDETYRLRLGAVGVASCKDLGRDAFRRFLRGLAALPDSPNWEQRRPHRAQPPETRSARG